MKTNKFYKKKIFFDFLNIFKEFNDDNSLGQFFVVY
jgi:hypothetical protein